MRPQESTRVAQAGLSVLELSRIQPPPYNHP